MKSLAHIYALMMMSGCFMGPEMLSSSIGSKDLTEDDIKHLIAKSDRLRKEQLLKKGCQEFHYEYRISDNMVKEFTVIALNKKNADKKYEKCIKLWKESI